MNCLFDPSGRSIRLSVRLQEYAETYVANIERYKAYQHLSNDEVLELLPVLLRDAASDFYESLNADQKTNWTVSRTPSYNVLAILQPNAGRTPTFYGDSQGDLNVDDYLTCVTCLAKHLPDLDESMLCHAIIRGFKPHIRSHVLQADARCI